MRSKNIVRSVVVATLASLLLSGCATVTRGTKQALVVESDPAGATIEVNGQRATTPASFKLSRKFEGPVMISKEGYETLTVQVTSQPSTAGGIGMAGNVLIGGLIGMGLDAATGSTNELKPNPIQVKLVPLGSAVIAPAAAPAPEAEPVATAPTEGTPAAAEAATATAPVTSPSMAPPSEQPPMAADAPAATGG